MSLRTSTPLVILLAACSGTIGGSGGSDPDREPGPTSCTGAEPAPLRRLTSQQLVTTFRALYGEEVAEALGPALGGFPADPLVNATADHSELQVEQLVSLVERASELLVSAEDTLAARGLRCVTGSPDAACVEDFVRDFGARAWRHPLQPDEVTELVAFHVGAPDSREGVIQLAMRMALAPRSVFHVEVDGDVDGDLLRIDGHTVANRLAFALHGGPPSAGLRMAAADGEVDDLAGATRWAELLMEQPAARAKTLELFHWLLELGERPAPDPDYLPADLDTEGLREALLNEVDATIEALVLDQGGSFEALMTSTEIRATDPRVAEIHGVPIWSPGSPAPTAPGRPGLLLHAGALLGELHPTAPILRGVQLRRRILCGELPAPTQEVIDARLDVVDPADLDGASSREQITLITADEACMSCHERINPLAFAFGAFDGAGAHRPVERVESSAGWVEHAVDTRTEVVLDGTRHEVDDATELMALLGRSEEAAGCFARRVYEHVHQREVSASCELEVLGERAREGAPIRRLMVDSIVNEALFERRWAEE